MQLQLSCAPVATLSFLERPVELTCTAIRLCTRKAGQRDERLHLLFDSPRIALVCSKGIPSLEMSRMRCTLFHKFYISELLVCVATRGY